ncbi:MAG: hypothetical protein CVU08_14345, partial [Bacteroidetes bacterium HGW-Bacteroidetes-3]
IFLNKKNKKIPIQLTVDKNVLPKLEKDLIKINKLIEDYEYSDNFYFYYSRGISETKINLLREKARKDFSINLEIFDNKRIASNLLKPEYFLAREKLKEFLGEILNEDQIYDEKDKLYSDFLLYGNQSHELKEMFLNSFILNELYKCKDYTSNKNILREKANLEFNLSSKDTYCDRLINHLLSSNKIISDGSVNVKLTDDEREKIKSIKENSNLLERDFLTSLQKLIVKYDINIELKDILDKLNDVYQEVSEVDVKEINEEFESADDVKNSIKELYKYINTHFEDKKEAHKFIIEVFNLCSENNFIHKISAGKLFKKLINSSEFGAYTRRLKKEVFLDTPVLIFLLMAMHEPHLDYNNYKFKIAQELFHLIQNDKETAVYNTTEHYIKELADHINNAIRLIPIEELGLFKSLGGTNNEILNLYFKSKSEGHFEGSFSSYIESFGISIIQVSKNENYLEQYLINNFKVNGINVDEVFKYDTNYKTKKDYEKIEKTLMEIYSDETYNRKSRSLRFDALFFMHIYYLQEDLIDPTILTWDNSFIEFRKRFQPKNPTLRYWHLFRPGKFLDHISLIKFKINGSSISNEILSIIDTDFEVVKGVKKLADILSNIVDLKTETGTRLTKGLSDIRDEYIYKINKIENQEVEPELTQPIDELVSNLVTYYSSDKSEFKFEDFTSALNNQLIISKFLVLLNKESENYLKSREFSLTYKSNVDNLIKEFKQI